MYFKKQVQIKAQVRTLLFDKALTKILIKYFDYSNIFSVENLAKLPEKIAINKHIIKLAEDKQLLFGPIYSLESIELEILKTYIETNLTNSFIRCSKYFAKAPILFNKKLDRSLHLCIYYRGFNNQTIKNQYLLLLIGESRD